MQLYSNSASTPSGTADGHAIQMERYVPSHTPANDGQRGVTTRAMNQRRWNHASVAHLLSRGANTVTFAVAYLLLAAALPIMLATAPITRISSGDIDDD